MNRKITFLLAGFLTAGVITAVVSLTYSAAASSVGMSAAAPPTAIQAASKGNANSDLSALYQKRESALQARVAEGQRAIKTLDETMQPQLNDLNAEIQIVTNRVAEKAQQTAALKDSAAQFQAQIEQEGQDIPQQVAALQKRESQARSQVDAATAQLQAAYDLHATRQVATASSSGGSSAGGDSSNNNSQHDDNDEHNRDKGDEGHQDSGSHEHEDDD